MITCEKCGTKVLDNVTACPGCGAEVKPAAAVSAGAEPLEGDGPNADGPNLGGDGPNKSGDDGDDLTESDVSAKSPSKGASAKTKALIAAAVALAVAGLLIFWQAKVGRAHTLNLSPEDMALIAEGVPPQQRAALASDAEARKEMAKSIREFLAIADEARSKGFGDRPEVKRQLETMRHFVVAQTYALKQREAGAAAQGQLFTKEEVEGFLKEPGKDQQFDQVVADAQKVGMLPAELEEQQKQQVKQQWGTIMLLSRKGSTAGVDKERKTQLQIELQQAKALAEIYSEDMAKTLEPSEAEINAKMDEARKKAEEVLKRARAGENFEELAKQFSDEPGAKERGGDLDWFGRGQMVKEFEETAFAMQEGQVSDVIETQFGFHVIKVEGKRTDKGPDGKEQEQVRARHVLIRPPGIAEPNRFGPPKPLREQVKESLARERQEQKIKEIVERSKVKVPEEFAVKAPETPQLPPGMANPHGGPPPTAEETLPDEHEGEGEGKAGGARPKPAPTKKK